MFILKTTKTLNTKCLPSDIFKYAHQTNESNMGGEKLDDRFHVVTAQMRVNKCRKQKILLLSLLC